MYKELLTAKERTLSSYCHSPAWGGMQSDRAGGMSMFCLFFLHCINITFSCSSSFIRGIIFSRKTFCKTIISEMYNFLMLQTEICVQTPLLQCLCLIMFLCSAMQSFRSDNIFGQDLPGFIDMEAWL